MPRITFSDGTSVRTFHAPLPGFSPLTASPRELLKHGFPKRPDDPEQLKHYNRIVHLMKGNFTYIEPSFSINPNRRHVSGKPRGNETATGEVVANVVPAVVGAEDNNLWSGGVVFPPAGESFRWITGCWTIPNLRTSTSDAQTYYCTIWIGIDGDAQVGSMDLCQAGVNIDVTGESLKCAAFCEWYPGSELAVNLPVTFGDTMVVTICTTGSGATEATIYMTNLTQKVGTSFTLDAPTNGDGSPVSLVGDSAQWVVERPVINGASSMLADYYQVFFDGASAVSYSPDGSSSTVANGNQTYIQMVPFGSTEILSSGILIAPQVIQCRFYSSGSVGQV
jgi:hypothetical protein